MLVFSEVSQEKVYGAFLPSVGNAGWFTTVCLKLIAEQRIQMVCVIFRMTRDKSYNALVVIPQLEIEVSSRVCLLVQQHVSAFSSFWLLFDCPYLVKTYFLIFYGIYVQLFLVDTEKTNFPAVFVHRYAYSFERRHRVLHKLVGAFCTRVPSVFDWYSSTFGV